MPPLAFFDATAFLPPEAELEALTESPVFLPIYLGLLALTAVGVWATFVKAGQRGWTSVIPLVNLLVLLKIVGKRPLWAALFFVPVVNILFTSFVTIRVAQHFGKGIGFGLGLVFFPYVFYPILGFGSARYQAAARTHTAGPSEQAPPTSQVQYRKAG